MNQPIDLNALSSLVSGFPARPGQTRSVAENNSLSSPQMIVPPTLPKKPSTTQIEQAVTQVNDHLQSQHRELLFSVDKSTGGTLVKVVDQKTGQVLRQIPPEYMVQLAQALQKENYLNTIGVKLKS